ncbi:MAG: pyruvate, water dikinase regulatory protein [Caldilineaceae bacterium]
MMAQQADGQKGSSSKAQPIFIISGGTGASGELLVHTVLAQFRASQTPIQIEAHVHTPQQVVAAVAKAAAANGLIVHTMVNARCRQTLMTEAARRHVPTFDLAGPLLDHLAGALNQEPIGQPGLYRQLHAAYYQRVEAINFAVAHDDGQRPEDLPLADIVLVGVSRVGKTPLSMYLSVLGWKVANVPFTPEIAPPPALLAVEPRRVFGLMIEPPLLLVHRRARQSTLGLHDGAYFDRCRIAEELRAANRFFVQHNFTVIDVTDKPIESSSDEIMTILSRQGG